jgi:hydroxyacylglutathione hydrolase
MQIVTIEIPELGNRAHLVHDGAHAVVVDPPRHLASIERAADALGVRIVAAADTHLHHDYVSGAPALARRHGADHLFSADERVQFDRVGVRGGDVLTYGRLELRVLDTPGHTFHHQSFLVSEPGSRPQGPSALLSGGSLLHGTVGRTDLSDPGAARQLARRRWRCTCCRSRGSGAAGSRGRGRPGHGRCATAGERAVGLRRDRSGRCDPPSRAGGCRR